MCLCLYDCSSRSRSNAYFRNLPLNQVTITPESPVSPPALLRDPLFSLIPAPIRRSSPPCPHCPRRRRIPPRRWTVLLAHQALWVPSFYFSVAHTLVLAEALSLIINLPLNNPFGPSQEILPVLLLRSSLQKRPSKVLFLSSKACFYLE